MSAMSDLSIVTQDERWANYCNNCMYWNHWPNGMPCNDCLFEALDPETGKPEYYEED